jgi:aarF domain-containing kinase
LINQTVYFSPLSSLLLFLLHKTKVNKLMRVHWRPFQFQRSFSNSLSSRYVSRPSRKVIAGTLTALPLAYLIYQSDTASGLKRVGRALSAASLIALDYTYSVPKHDPTDSDRYTEALHKTHLRCAKRLLHVFQANGGVYIKIGQHLAALEYLLPIEYCDTMKVLQNEAPQTAIEDVRQLFRMELKQDLNEVFLSFDETPIGAASLAQVHRARLRSNGKEVAVKIQHPSIRSYADIDIATVAAVNRLLAFFFPNFELTWLVEEMRTNLPNEINFISEGLNAERIEQHLGNEFGFVKIPQIEWAWTTPRVLTMEFVEGAKVDDLGYLDSHSVSRQLLSERLNRVFSTMIFKFGFVHCDPHPGNVLVRAKELSLAQTLLSWLWVRPNCDFELILLDHGLYKQLTREFRASYAQLWLAIVDGNEHQIKQCCERLGGGDLYQLFSCILTQRHWDNVKNNCRLGMSPEQELEVRTRAVDYMPEVASLLARIPRQMVLMLKTNDLLRSLDRSLGVHNEVGALFVMAEHCIQSLKQSNLQRTNFWQRRAADVWSLYLTAKLRVLRFFLPLLPPSLLVS